MDEREPREKRVRARLARGVGGARRRKTKRKRTFRRGWCEGEEEEKEVVVVVVVVEEEDDGSGGVGGGEAYRATTRDESAPVGGRPRITSRLIPARGRVA